METFGQYMTRDGLRLMHRESGNDWIGPVVTLIIVFILAGVMVYLIKTIARAKVIHPDQQDPLAIAKVRFAKGEISKTEFDEIKKEVSKD